MPLFGNPFAGNTPDKKLNKEELIRALRFVISAEYEAIQLYQQLKESIDDEYVKKILEEISGDEQIHAGQFLEVLFRLNPGEMEKYEQGYKENKEIENKE